MIQYKIILITLLLFYFPVNSQIIKTDESGFSKTKYDSIIRTLNYKEGDRVAVYTQFRFNDDLEITDIRVRAPYRIFEEKAKFFLRQLSLSERRELNRGKQGEPIELPLTIIIRSGKDDMELRSPY